MKTNFRLATITAAFGLFVASLFTSCQDEIKNLKVATESTTKGARIAAAVDSIIGGNCAASTSTPTNTIINTTRVLSGTYILRNYLRVVPGGRLIIKPGTVIKGECRGTIVVERGGFIDARGLSTSPIVMTSNKAAGSKAPGDWGGVVVLGRAHNNQGGNIPIEGLVGLGTPSSTSLGYFGPGGASGNITTYNTQSSGFLQYIRIEYAGTIIGANNETNGLTLASVGSGTVVDHVQVLYGRDDAFEFFGGTVNAKYLYSYSNNDDDFDTDFGYTGRIQFAVAVRNPNLYDNAGSAAASNGFESDNDAAGSTKLPLTNPRFANVTVVGPARPSCSPVINSFFGAGALLRRNTAIDIYNSAFIGFKTGINATGANAGVDLKSVSVFNPNEGATCFTPASLTGINCYDATACGTSTGSLIAVTRLPSTAWAACPTVPNLVPASTSPLATAGTTTPGTGFVSTTYRGAFGPSSTQNTAWNLTSGWLSFKCLGQ